MRSPIMVWEGRIFRFTIFLIELAVEFRSFCVIGLDSLRIELKDVSGIRRDTIEPMNGIQLSPVTNLGTVSP
ncbi:hypothetical protein BDFB_002435 [Asbolus verrucosus]|uniref:Uncharacterized protein n=1 Tax=Asbolus verrucosus TaxID=1661398 RepID=A0A482VJD3_ASBVE|nr:hypothetical protein BDFB_002435 [Asbolus verrucosus]